MWSGPRGTPMGLVPIPPYGLTTQHPPTEQPLLHFLAAQDVSQCSEGAGPPSTYLDLVAHPPECDKSRFRSDDEESECKLQPKAPGHSPPGHLPPNRKVLVSSVRGWGWGVCREQHGIRPESVVFGWSVGQRLEPARTLGLWPMVTSTLESEQATLLAAMGLGQWSGMRRGLRTHARREQAPACHGPWACSSLGEQSWSCGVCHTFPHPCFTGRASGCPDPIPSMLTPLPEGGCCLSAFNDP